MSKYVFAGDCPLDCPFLMPENSYCKKYNKLLHKGQSGYPVAKGYYYRKGQCLRDENICPQCLYADCYHVAEIGCSIERHEKWHCDKCGWEFCKEKETK
jgi:hypothetical protein